MKRYQYDINVTDRNDAYRYNDGQIEVLYGWIMPIHAHKPYIYRGLIVYFLMINQGRRGFLASRGRTQANKLYITSLCKIGLIRRTGGLIVYFFPFFALGWDFVHEFGSLPGSRLPFPHGINIPILTLIYVHARTYIILYIYGTTISVTIKMFSVTTGEVSGIEPIPLITSDIDNKI